MRDICHPKAGRKKDPRCAGACDGWWLADVGSVHGWLSLQSLFWREKSVRIREFEKGHQVGGFKYFLFSSLFGEDPQFD